jgi:L-threonylcarbamoyladenylate synthase
MIEVTKDINRAAFFLNNNEVIGMPTETVYGLAGNIYSEQAVKKIFEVKQRPFYNPLIVHIKSVDQLEKVAVEIPEQAIKLSNHFWPGPLTLLLKKHPSIPNIITAGKETVAVRIPKHPTAQSLLALLDYPLAAPSANPFGSISPTTAEHVAEYFSEKIPAVLDGGTSKNGLESTIIGFIDNQAVLFRHGAISIEEIEAVIGKITIKTSAKDQPDAPGMLLKHYAPNTPTFVTDDVKSMINSFSRKKVGLILFKDKIENADKHYYEVLAENGDLQVAGANLYAAMHRLDKQQLDAIIIEKLPNIGIGRSINDRLERARFK